MSGTVDARLGIHHDLISLQFTRDEFRRACELLGWDRHTVEVFPHSHRVALVPLDGAGSLGARCSKQRCAGDEVRVTAHTDLHEGSMARCSLFEVRLEYDRETGLTGRIPPCHELPWPRLHRECKAYYTPEVIVREVMIRRRSALRAGMRTMPPIPSRLLDQLGQPERTTIYQLSRAYQEELRHGKV